MNRPADESEKVLLRCRLRRGLAAAMASAGLAVALACGYLLLVDRSADVRASAALQGLLAVLGLLAAAAAGVYLRRALDPPVLFEATRRGLVVRREGDRPLDEPRFVPWERVRALEYRVSRGIDSGGDLARVETVAVTLRSDAEPRPAEPVLHLDAFSGRPHGAALLRRLEEIRSRHAPVA